MSESKHTPGPWSVDEDTRPGMEWNRHIYGPDGLAVCFMAHSDGKATERDEANAALIASAPDLAAEVERLRAEREDDEATRAMMADILSRTAVALRGPEPEGTRYGWSDLPERVAAAVAAIDVMQRAAANLAADAADNDATLKAAYENACAHRAAVVQELAAERRKVEALESAIGMAYGYLWCVNNEPGTPNQYPPEKAAYEARKLLRDTLTKEQRGDFINRVLLLVRGGGAALAASQKGGLAKDQNSDLSFGPLAASEPRNGEQR